MTPLFFGTRERRLFGVYESAASSSQHRRAAVLCYPFGMEYMFAHRAMRLLAGRLAIAGFHTLRFDYYGTGDSAGTLLEDGMAGLQADIETAATEIGTIADAASVALVGLRLGATLAANVAAKTGSANALVLWDPVVSGRAYLGGMTPVALARGEEPVARSKDAQSLTDARFDLEGCIVLDAFLGELRELELAPELAAVDCRRLALFTQPAAVPPTLQSLATTPGVTFEALASPAPWTEAASSAGLVPAAAIQRIVDWLA